MIRPVDESSLRVRAFCGEAIQIFAWFFVILNKVKTWIASPQKARLAMTKQPSNICKPTSATAILLLTLALSPLSFAANQRDLDKLMQLQKSVQTIRIDLSSTDLRKYPFIPGKIDLQQANISHSNLSGLDLSKFNLGGADLSYSDLSNTKLNQANLADANLSHANLTGAQIQQSDLSRANLTCANLTNADLSKSTFNEATISGATFINTNTADILGYTSVSDGIVKCEESMG